MRHFRRLTNPMTRILRLTPGDETSKQRIEVLFGVFLNGDNLKQQGPAVVRQRGRLRKLFDTVGDFTEGPPMEYHARADVTALELSQEDHTYLEKCWSVYEVRGLFADRAADCLDWFEAAEKHDPSAKADPPKE